MSAPRLAEEIPLADEGPQAAAQLAAELLAGLPAEEAKDFTLVFADVEAALSAPLCLPGKSCVPASRATLIGVCAHGSFNGDQPGLPLYALSSLGGVHSKCTFLPTACLWARQILLLLTRMLAVVLYTRFRLPLCSTLTGES